MCRRVLVQSDAATEWRLHAQLGWSATRGESERELNRHALRLGVGFFVLFLAVDYCISASKWNRARLFSDVPRPAEPSDQ